MLETDYGRDNPALWLTQLLEALVRNCRYLCSLGMHTQGMTLDEAARFFQAHAYMEEHPAYQEAIRGTFDPGYLNYTLGKLMLLKTPPGLAPAGRRRLHPAPLPRRRAVLGARRRSRCCARRCWTLTTGRFCDLATLHD